MRFSKPVDTSYIRWDPIRKQAKTDLEKELVKDIELLQKQIEELYEILYREPLVLGGTCESCPNAVGYFESDIPKYECKVTGNIHIGDWKCNVKISREGKIEEV